MFYYILNFVIGNNLADIFLSDIMLRALIAFFTSFILGYIIYPLIIDLQLKKQMFQPIRIDGPDSHYIKNKTPTMGGIGILLLTLIAVFLWSNFQNYYVWIALFVMLSYGLLGFVDDFLKVTKKNSRGVRGQVKILFQLIVSVVTCILLVNIDKQGVATIIFVPILQDLTINLGLFYVVFGSFVMIGASNAVNLTDGLDGLATFPTIIVVVFFAVLTFLIGNIEYAGFLKLRHIPDVGEILVFCLALAGSCVSFLWFNAPKAEIFMGDTGSLALGGTLGAISLMIKQEILLAIIAGVFVMEAISVILQVYYFKFTGGKRIFLMSPLHHHFEKLGWKEEKVVIRFWVLSMIFAALGILVLKLS